jgi:hypothetical protein
MSYGPDTADVFRRSAAYVDRILDRVLRDLVQRPGLRVLAFPCLKLILIGETAPSALSFERPISQFPPDARASPCPPAPSGLGPPEPDPCLVPLASAAGPRPHPWPLAELVGVAGMFGVHSLDGAAFIVPPLEGLLAGIVLTFGALVWHGSEYAPGSPRSPPLVKGKNNPTDPLPNAQAGAKRYCHDASWVPPWLGLGPLGVANTIAGRAESARTSWRPEDRRSVRCLDPSTVQRISRLAAMTV